VLETERLVLRAPRRADAPALLDAWRDADTMRYFGAEPLARIRDALDQIRDFHEETATGDGIRWILTRRAKDEYIGDIGFFDHAPEHSRAEVGFILARPYWRQGLMAEALAAVLDYGFEAMRLHRVEALVDPRNGRSLQTLERAGFRREGLLRDYEFERGEFIDLALLAHLRSERASSGTSTL
jgi:ribosomal-protein-alanine N-acetyltransferase